MTATRMRRIVVSLVVGAGVVGAILVTVRARPDPPPGDVRNVIAAYLANEEAAREEYRDTPVTASGVVRWSARRDQVTARAADDRSPQLEEWAKEAVVLIVVDDRHEILADFGAENQRAALALRKGDRVTIKGRHYGGSFTSVAVYNGKVIMIVTGCELIR